MNEPKMTREQRDMAVAIAKDILDQIKAENSFTMTEGVYFQTPIDLGKLDGDLQTHLGLIQPFCHVCMLGALVLCKARKYDNVPIGLADRGTSGSIREALADVFDPHTLDCLESAFELSDMSFDPDDDIRGAVTFGRKFCGSTTRAVAIAENIIENDGLFVVEPVSEEDFEDEDFYDDDEEWDDEDEGDDEDDDDEEWDDEDEGDDDETL